MNGLPESAHYAEPYVSIEGECAHHRIKYRVDFTIPDGCALQPFQHCAGDREERLIGPILGIYERQDGKWIPVESLPDFIMPDKAAV